MALVETAKFPSAIATEADMQNWKNVTTGAATPTLAASVGTTDTTFTLASGTGAALPQDHFTVTIDAEIIFVTSRTNDTLTIGSRGYEGTTAAVHGAGATVTQNITAKSHNQIVSEIYAIQNALGTSLNKVVLTTQMGAVNGVATLDSNGLIPSSQLPGKNVTTVSANTTLSSESTVLATASSAGITLTLPSASGNLGLSYIIKKVDSAAGAVSIAPQSGQTIEGGSTYVLVNQYQYVELVSDGSNWYVLRAN